MRSDAVKKGSQQAPHRSLFNALGMTKEEMELFRDGIKNYTMKVKKDGQSIIIKPVETRQKTGGKSVRK